MTIGLALAHWFAFRLSARLVGAGRVGLEDATSAAAQVAGAAAVALLASLAVILVPSPIELEVVELTLGGFLGVVGFTVARVGGATRPRAVAYFLSVLVFAVAVALVKNLLAGH